MYLEPNTQANFTEAFINLSLSFSPFKSTFVMFNNSDRRHVCTGVLVPFIYKYYYCNLDQSPKEHRPLSFPLVELQLY